MSAQATINLVDDEEMSSQGSVNAPVAPQHGPIAQGPTHQTPLGLPAWPGTRGIAATQQSGVAGPSIVPSKTIPVQSTEVIAATTIPIDALSRTEMKQAFDEVSSALHTVSSVHEKVKAGMQTLASGVEQLHRARAGDVEQQRKFNKHFSECCLHQARWK